MGGEATADQFILYFKLKFKFYKMPIPSTPAQDFRA